MNATTSVAARKTAGADPHSILHPQGIDGRPIANPPSEAHTTGPGAPSPSLITLQVRSRKQFFEGHRIPLGQQAGFTWSGLEVRGLGLLSRDEETPIAVMKVDGRLESFGELQVIEICFNPETCALEVSAAERIISAAVRFAELADGELCDGTGHVLTADELEALKDHFLGIIVRRRKEARPAPIEMPDGTLRVPGVLSYQFEKRVKTARGSRGDGHVYFDAPALPYYEGQAEGYRMAVEMVDFIKGHKVTDTGIYETIAEALGVALVTGSCGKTTRDNVVYGFMAAIEKLVRVGARHANPRWFSEQIEFHERWGAKSAEAKAADKRNFVERMRAGRAAKKARAEGGAA